MSRSLLSQGMGPVGSRPRTRGQHPAEPPLRLCSAHQDVAYKTKTLAAREMALRASLEMLTPSGSCDESGDERTRGFW